MTYKLSQIERTLLSAYLDGEVSPAERLRVEQLLKNSEQARQYLRDLHAVDHLATVATTVSGGAAISSAAVSAKLTGSAIQAVARRTAISKVAGLSSWGVAGLAGVAATVVVGVALSVRPSVPVKTANGDGTSRNKVETAAVPTTPAIDLDSTTLLIPPMTTADLYAFAVHGTLPLDAKRKRFITLDTKGDDSLQVKVHAKMPEEMESALADIEPAIVQVLDSIQQVVRTSLLRSADGEIVLRSDIPQVRLQAIRSLELMAPQLPQKACRQLERTRTELAAVEQVERRSTAPSYAQASGAARPVSYKVIYQNAGWNAQELPTSQFVVRFDGNEDSFVIDSRSLGSLQATMRTAPSAPVAAAIEELQVSAGAMADARAKRIRMPARPSTPLPPSPPSIRNAILDGRAVEQDAIGQSEEATAQETWQTSTYRHDIEMVFSNEDSVIHYTRVLIDSAGRSLRRVDSILQRVEIRVRNGGGGGNIQIGGGGQNSINVVQWNFVPSNEERMLPDSDDEGGTDNP